MNRLKNIFTVVAAGLLLSPFVACKKLLDQEPINSPYNNVFWKNQRDAEQGVAGGYALLRRALTTNNEYDMNLSHFAYGTLPAFEFDDYRQYDLGFLVKSNGELSTANFIGSYLDAYHDWSPYFKVVTQANLILHYLPGIPNEQFTESPARTRNRLLGEAYFLRAYSYFYMVRLWGDVPLVTKFDGDPAQAQNVPRTNEKVVLDNCVEDLKKAISLLPWEYKNGMERAVRANRGAAFGLLAHVYMWKNFLNKGTVATDRTNAIAAVDSLEKSGQYQLLPAASYPKIFRGKTAEGIFELNMQVADGEQQVQKGFYYSIMKTPFIQNKTSKPDVLNKALVDRLYEEDDLRLQYYFSGLKAAEPEKIVICKFSGPNRENIYYKNPGNFSDAAVDANLILMRYADLLLLRAEAYADQGNIGAALKDVNAVRIRAGASPSDGNGDIRYEVFAERTRELYAEGQRWYDLVRTGYLATEENNKFGQSRYNAEGWKWPVSRKLFLNNTVITQNKFWLGKVK
ncbi:RagB/SusD family nutrient uptake outer membrane protein [Chitinophaga nivalis]|uniref:RagB/SusD family nutrient uptake outer membrane protein n=1 Tax=Chitinophaga nivalis TaxID=2991709 RepID=A0ABT3IQN3_9BACT|nr:RagB/SusD family nutrient uptake outer membrane protein [Chitinophaga nivalis]MCW3464057.1 RagB/SusD family nutrient uptake outer membrane protein [Chitinophaga nivalis]MCW3486253.1 RagB/SusD family nutrient uptake outer membrane protein [Chitinophaga nivalis]